MSSDVVSNPFTPATTESKSARKKKAKAEAAASASAAPAKSVSEHSVTSPGHEGKTNGIEASSESPYLKELQKSVASIPSPPNSNTLQLNYRKYANGHTGAFAVSTRSL
jgi:hypothetical protein